MIDLSHANPSVLFVIGVTLFGVYCWMMTERVSSRIRNSEHWYVGWFASIMILATGGKLMMPVLNGLPIDDDIAVPAIFVVVAALIVVIFFVQTYRLRRELKQG